MAQQQEPARFEAPATPRWHPGAGGSFRRAEPEFAVRKKPHHNWRPQQREAGGGVDRNTRREDTSIDG